MKRIALFLLLGIAVSSCSSSSDNEPNPTATEKTIYVNTNIPSGQEELLIFVNGGGSARVTAKVKVGDVVRVESRSTAPPSTSYYITVDLDSKQLVDHFTTPQGEKMIWSHTITTQDFE